MVKTKCLWDVAIKMNSSIDSANVLVANLKLYSGFKLATSTFVLSIHVSNTF